MHPAAKRLSLLATSAATAVLLLAGCTSGGHSTGANGSKDDDTLSGTITVFAAASLQGVFSTIGAQFEAQHPGVHVRFNFGASSALALQINQGAPADVFASAAVKNMQQVIDAGGSGSASNFAKNVMEIAVPPQNPGAVHGVADLARHGVKVALCQPQVPCGATAQQVFVNAHVSVHPVTLEADVKSTLAKVELNEVDAGVVYVTDVRAAGNRVLGVPIDASVNASTEYPITVLSKAQNIVVARAFENLVLSPQGQKVLTAAGFSAP